MMKKVEQFGGNIRKERHPIAFSSLYLYYYNKDSEGEGKGMREGKKTQCTN
jgi:hypothetical protein